MRITIVGPSYPLRGGIAHHVYWLERAFTGRGHQVQVALEIGSIDDDHDSVGGRLLGFLTEQQLDRDHLVGAAGG